MRSLVMSPSCDFLYTQIMFLYYHSCDQQKNAPMPRQRRLQKSAITATAHGLKIIACSLTQSYISFPCFFIKM